MSPIPPQSESVTVSSLSKFMHTLLFSVLSVILVVAHTKGRLVISVARRLVSILAFSFRHIRRICRTKFTARTIVLHP